jgi:thiamine-phosphate pyrophosphorylase
MHHISNIKYYFINNFDTNNIDQQEKPTIIIYRNYSSKKVNQLEILKFKNYCKKKGLKFYLSNNVKLAIKLRLDGAYIPSFNKKFNHLSCIHNNDFKIVGSAHNLKEIRIKELQNVDKIFLSSLFKKNRNYLGINKFKLMSNLTKKKIVVLGGISKKNIKLLNLLNK